LKKRDTHQHKVFRVMLWSLWKHSNNKVKNDANETIQEVCERACSLLASWKNS